MKRRLLNLLTDCREKRWVFLLLSSTRAVRAMACSNHYFPGPHTWRAQSPAVPSPPPSSHVFTLQLCSRNGYSVVRNFCGIKFPPVLESYIQTHPQPRPQGFSLKKWVGREKALASAGHVYSLNIPEKLIYMQPAGFALTEGSNNGK